MLNLKLEIDMDSMIDSMDDMEVRNIPYAGFLALKETVFKSSMKIRSVMDNYIDGGAIPFTKRGILYRNPKSKKRPVGWIYIGDNQWKYMQYIVTGKTKRWTRSVAGVSQPINVNLNKYGNIPGKARKERLWRGIVEQGMRSGFAIPLKKGLAKNQFIAEINGTVGLWKRPKRGGSPQLLIMFNKKGIPYRKTFPFVKLARQYSIWQFKKTFPKHFKQVVENEINKYNRRHSH